MAETYKLDPVVNLDIREIVLERFEDNKDVDYKSLVDVFEDDEINEIVANLEHKIGLLYKRRK